MPRPKSRAQARFYGAIAGGSVKLKRFPKSAAHDSLRGVKVSKLPAVKRKKKR